MRDRQLRRSWLTATTGLVGVLLVVLPILGGLFGDPDEASDAAYLFIPLLIALGALLLAGLWWLRIDRFTDAVCLTLIGVGLVAFGVLFFWMLLIPTAVSLIVIWFGIVRGGLIAELRPPAGI